MSNSAFLSDKNKLNLTKDDLFDRVINLKLFVHKKDSKDAEYVKGADAFIIRSDWEAVFFKQSVESVLQQGVFTSNAYYIRKCQYKPSIKVQYKKVSKDTAANIDIFISNFTIFTSDGKAMPTFNKEDYDLKEVEIMMGYWGQFKNASHRTLTDLFDFTPKFGSDLLSVQVFTVTVDKLAPNFTLHINGTVGNTTQPPCSTDSIDSFEKVLASGLMETFGNARPRQSDMSAFFSEHITRRFLRNTVNVRDNRRYLIKDILPVIPVLGKYSQTDANAYGVQVYTSPEVDKIEIKKIKDSEGKEVEIKVYFDEGDTLDNAMTKCIQAVYPAGLVYTMLNTGDLLLYTKEEAQDLPKLADSLSKFYKKDSVFNKVYKNQLPAVYSINIGETVFITCPFFAFIEPFEEIKFTSRGSLNSLVSFFANSTKDRNSFTVINYTVTFATVEDENVMEIYCVANDVKG